MNAKMIDLKDWVPFGGGGFGDSYYHKTDDSVVLKLNKPNIPARRALIEYQRSKAVYEMGIPSAQPFDYVTDGKRYGMTVERIRGKESFGRIIADNPHRLEELACTTAEYAKALHSMPCDTEIFDSSALRVREIIGDSMALPDDIKARLIHYIDELEPATTCLHGDINPCNIIMADGKIYWIDLGDFGYGDPMLDFNHLSHMSGYSPNPLLKQLFHMDRKMLFRFYDVMGRHYYGPRWDGPELKEKMSRITQIMAGEAMCLFPQAYHVNLPFLQRKRILTQVNLFIGDHIRTYENH
jgi:uncharacterized protein (TIGR02172 family)